MDSSVGIEWQYNLQPVQTHHPYPPNADNAGTTTDATYAIHQLEQLPHQPPPSQADVPTGNVCPTQTMNNILSTAREADQNNDSHSKGKNKVKPATHRRRKQNLHDDGSLPNPDRISAKKDYLSTRQRTKPYSRPGSAADESADSGNNPYSIAYRRKVKPNSSGNKGRKLIRAPAYDNPNPTLINECILPTNMGIVEPVDTVPIGGSFSQIVFAIKCGLAQPGHSDAFSIDLESVGKCDERSYSIIRTFFESPHLDVLQGFDAFISANIMEATLAYFNLSSCSAANFVKPSACQMAACMIMLDIIDLVTAAWNNPYSGFFLPYSGFFLPHALKCLDHVAWSRYDRWDKEFPYALLFLGLRTFYSPEERSEVRLLLGLISELLHRQSQIITSHNQYSGITVGPTFQFLDDSFAILCAMSGSIHPSHANIEPDFLQDRLNDIKRLGSMPCVTNLSRKELLFKARATLAYWHLRMWFIPETYYKSSAIREFRETKADIERLLAARRVELQPSCLHY
ncbi:hypothetical protein SISSUDRAFT_1046985 [Sistotremastrum suecicum HHB10207 ss-3]|uniref:Uncharacterized protein n=1 Tax=Sistotremastrum suecicum HHB10207 ss-3 TaxID=1314776 RepID=A0A166DEG6_9AGAM|nr:hypothetical protein SISSUDRAFT_1046985 [Sistotremastrum suecicum HHB10207 ss-3]